MTSKKEFVESYARRKGISKKEANEEVSAFLDTLTDALYSEENVTFPGIMTIKVCSREARVYRNPHTGEPVPKPSKKILKITTHRGFSERLNSK